jgi:hypothetical protein
MNATRNILTLACAVVAVCVTPSVKADFKFGQPAGLESAIPALDGAVDWADCFLYDGLEMYISSLREGGGQGQGIWDLWVLKRASVAEEWGPPENLGPAVNSPQEDSCSSISPDGLSLYFCSDRPGGHGEYDIYVTTRPTKGDPWNPPMNLGPTINCSATDGVPWISPDGLELYFQSYRQGGYGGSDIFLARRATTQDPWGSPVNLGPVVNSAYDEHFPSLSPDGLLLLFSDHPWEGTPRPGGYGSSDIWMAKRESPSASWQAPVNLGPIVNGAQRDALPRISLDGSTLYFRSDRVGGFDSWQASIIPIVDFDGDGKVDDQDMIILSEHWGLSYPPCDIGPFAWGDGVVDEKDLRVLMERLMTPGSQTLDVSCDTILSWVGPGFADSYDVYFGTSSADVSEAIRDDPRGVLVSQGQLETTCDPEELLEFSQTYYWRVDVIDVVAGSLEPVIYKGPVLSFTSEAYVYSIQNMTATASSRERSMGPENTVNGSGLDENDGHSTDGTAMWLSKSTGPHWIQYEFDKVYALHELWVWNSNQLVEPILGFGAKTVKIEYSVDGATWTTLEAVPEFARAPGESGYKPNTTVGFGGVLAKYVKLTIEANWGPVAQTGLAEVRFFHIPDRPWATMP